MISIEQVQLNRISAEAKSVMTAMMELDWTTLYDYISIFSKEAFKQKINKFYESFYPLKFKKTGKKSCELKFIERGGLLGIVASYIQQVLFALEIYLSAEYFLSEGKLKQQIKLSRMFVEIEKKNLELAIDLQKSVYIITEYSRIFNETSQDKLKEKQYLEIKIICSLNRIFEFFYDLHAMRVKLPANGFEHIESTLRLFSIRICQKSANHIKLFPQIGEILVEILRFFSSENKQTFNFHSHLLDTAERNSRSFPERVKKLVAVIPNKQKGILVNLSDEIFYEYLVKCGVSIPKEPIENYFRCEEEVNSIIAEEQNFKDSILISEKFRGKKEWREKVREQLVNLSLDKQKNLENKNDTTNKLLAARSFRLSEDFPLEL